MSTSLLCTFSAFGWLGDTDKYDSNCCILTYKNDKQMMNVIVCIYRAPYATHLPQHSTHANSLDSCYC